MHSFVASNLNVRYGTYGIHDVYFKSCCLRKKVFFWYLLKILSHCVLENSVTVAYITLLLEFNAMNMLPFSHGTIGVP